MVKLSILTSRELIKILKEKGFEKDHSTGSHFIFYHSINKKRVTVPFKRKDLPKGTIMSILKQTGISKKDLLNFKK